MGLRELIQNAHDSCLRRMIEEGEPGYRPRVQITSNTDQGTLTITDNGYGLLATEIDEYLATIGRSYTGELKNELGLFSPDEAAKLIGQFGFGFLSAFLLASEVTLITRRDVLLPSLLNAVNQYAEWATVFGFLPILARQLGATDVLQSMLMSLYIGLVILGNLVATAIVKQIGAQRLIFFSFFLFALGIGLAALAPGLPLLFAAQLCLGLGQGISYPVLLGMSIRHVAEAERATAMGLHQAVYALGMFAGPWLSGLLAEAIGLRPMFGITACACLMLGWLGSRWLAR